MDELPLTDIQAKITELVSGTPAPGKHCCRSAISHIKRSWWIRQMDKEMAAFRAITAEEESVSAIFHSLRRVGYEGADKLKVKSHVHKSALQPFLQAVENNLAQSKMDQFKPRLRIDLNEKNPKFEVLLALPEELGLNLEMSPIPPLNFTVKQNDKLYKFVGEILQVTNQHTMNKVIDHVKTLANRRNELLYASQNGVPQVKDLPESFLTSRRDRVFRNLTLFLLIDPYPVQLFVQQCLDAFLGMLKLLPVELETETN